MTPKEKLVKWCLAQVGYHEGANNWTKYAEGKAKYYGWNVQNQPWCDIFVDAAFIENFGENASALTYQPMGQFSALCSASAEFYKENQAFFQTPEVGDQIFLYSGGGVNHTGIVVNVSGGVVTTVEGNSADSVRKNTYAVGATVISGYGRPNWAVVGEQDEQGEQDKEKPSSLCTFTATLPVLRYGAVGWPVKVMQTALVGKGFSVGWMGTDGEYGEKTGKGLKQFQTFRGLEADGICGPQTWEKLLGVN